MAMGTPITIDQLIQETGINPASLLDDICSDDDLPFLAQFCDSWEIIGCHLNLSKEDLNAIRDEQTTDLKRLAVLRKWNKKNAFRATYRAFINALLREGNAMAAYKVCQEFQKHHCQPTAQTSGIQPNKEPATLSPLDINNGTQESGYGSQLKFPSQQFESGAAAAENNADTVDYRSTSPSPSVEPLKINETVSESQPEQNLLSATDEDVDEMDSDPPINDQSTSSPPLRSVDPLFYPTDDPQILRERDKMMSNALEIFKLESFLPDQKKVITNILSGTSTLLIQRVGFGKSLCYQLPAYLYSQSEPHAHCIILVISPLVSLMEDQVSKCPEELNMKCLHANQNKQQKADVLRELADGSISVLLLSPEALESGSFCNELGIPHLLGRLPQIVFACIDEAHCINEWSHNFRPSYFRIQKILRERLHVRCVLGLTATATHTTALSMANYLGIKEEDIIIGDSILPKNLHISVSQISSKYSERDKALIELLQSSKFKGCESIIIYCATRNMTDKLANMLNAHFKSFPENELESDQDEVPHVPNIPVKRKKKSTTGVSSKQQKTDCCVASYHGGKLPIERKKVQDDFMNGRVRIVVATVAFGMGLNKKDVRATIHYNMPKSIELFIQEIGRAGRDGKPAYCHVFIDKQKNDLCFNRRLAYENTVDPGALGQFMDKIFSSQHTQSLDFFLSQSSQSLTGNISGQQIVIASKEMEELDINEKCTATLLCYLELKGWLEITNVIYDTCTIKWGDSPGQLKALEKGFPIVAAAADICREKGLKLDYRTKMEFSMSELAKYVGKKFDEVYSELRCLKNNDQEAEQRENDELVEFSDRIFLILPSKDFSQEKGRDIFAYLQNKMKKQEESVVEKVHLLHAVLQSVTTQDRHSVELLTLIDRYFSKQELNIAYLKKHNIPIAPLKPRMSSTQKEKIEKEVMALLDLFRNIRSQFTGTAIARIFYGIGSPRFQYDNWRSQTRFWWQHVHMDFDKLRDIATSKLQ